MKWNHVFDNQPENGSIIFQLDFPYHEVFSGDFNEYYEMRITKFYKEAMKDDANFWWIYAKDFPFPDQLERSKREDSKCKKCRLKIDENHPIVYGGGYQFCRGNCI